jgi:hypothetical protein
MASVVHKERGPSSGKFQRPQRPGWFLISRRGTVRQSERIFDTLPSGYSRPKDMCRNIKPLFNFDPPTTEAEIRDASLQFVRKISGFSKPSRANEAAVNRAVAEVAVVARHLLDSLVTDAEPRNREVEAARARARAAERFGTS